MKSIFLGHPSVDTRTTTAAKNYINMKSNVEKPNKNYIDMKSTVERLVGGV